MDNFNVLLELLRSDGSIIVNKTLAREIGIESAIIYSELISKYIYFGNKGMLEDGYFFNTIDNMEFDTMLTKYAQSKAINNLVKLGLIEYKRKGMPAKRYFKILNNDIAYQLIACSLPKMENKFAENGKHVGENLENMLAENGNDNNTNINNTKNNTKNKNVNDDILEIFEYWKLKLNHKKAKYSHDKKRVILARLREGFTIEECKKAIDGCASSPFHTGHNNDKRKYDSIGLIFRNASKLEWFMDLESKPKNHIKSIKQQAEELAKRWKTEDKEKKVIW